ncbi:MAG: nitrile hydratase subunit alpha, partial [SAR324 cluster bacterium]|nr:nitrile hydratase subunit alpha [SAR324 cluster bacterium]
MSTHHHSTVPSDPELRVKALESLLVEKGLVDPKTLDELVDLYETKIGPRNGAKVVAKAWKDQEFKKYLFEKPADAIASIGYRGRQGEHMR